MKDLNHALKEMNVPDIVQEKAQDAFERIQEESRMSTNGNTRRKFFKGQTALVAAVIVVLLIGGGVVWAASGGLAGFLTQLMPEEEVIKRLDTPRESAITVRQSESESKIEDYGPLWTIEEYWYDGAILYFSARAPQKVVDAGNMIVEWKDHAYVNGTDCLLSADGCWEGEEINKRYSGFYLCMVDLSNADTSSGKVSLLVRLELKKYKLMPYDFVERPNNEVETLVQQELQFDFEKPSDMRQTKKENLPVEGGAADVSMTVAPSMLNISIVYHLNDSSKPVRDIVRYRVTDDKGNSTTFWVYSHFKDYNNDDCLVISEYNWEGLDPYSKSYTFEPLCFQKDSTGEEIHDAFDPLDWGGFTVEIK